jgi:hypothetical protein
MCAWSTAIVLGILLNTVPSVISSTLNNVSARSATKTSLAGTQKSRGVPPRLLLLRRLGAGLKTRA